MAEKLDVGTVRVFGLGILRWDASHRLLSPLTSLFWFRHQILKNRGKKGRKSGKSFSALHNARNVTLGEYYFCHSKNNNPPDCICSKQLAGKKNRLFFRVYTNESEIIPEERSLAPLQISKVFEMVWDKSDFCIM